MTRRIVAEVARSVTIIIAITASSQLGAQVPIVHPTPDNLIANVSVEISRTPAGGLPAALTAFAARLRRLREVRSVGKEDGDADDIIGAIAGAALDDQGRLLVLDRSFNNVRIHPAGAGKGFVFGRQGSGPLDFRSPMSIWPAGNGAVAVADGVLGVKFISAPSKAMVKLERIVSVGADITGGCGSSDTFAVYRTPSDDIPLIQRYDRNGKVLSAFGAPYKTSTPLVRAIMSEGVVGCMSDGQVAYAMSGLPYIHLHAANGQRRAVVKLTSFTIGEQLEEADAKGRHSIGLSESTRQFSSIRWMVGVDSRFLIVQVVNHTMASLRLRRDFATLDTYAIDVATGKGLFVSAGIPPLTYAVGTTLVGFTNDPYPRAIVWELPK
jgi:hypothetical protein